MQDGIYFLQNHGIISIALVTGEDTGVVSCGVEVAKKMLLSMYTAILDAEYSLNSKNEPIDFDACYKSFMKKKIEIISKHLIDSVEDG